MVRISNSMLLDPVGFCRGAMARGKSAFLSCLWTWGAAVGNRMLEWMAFGQIQYTASPDAQMRREIK